MSPTDIPEQDGDGIRVLLVDDSPEWLRFMERALATVSDAFEVRTAGSASQALTAVRKEGGLDCIVSDYQMPGTDGIDLLQRVREDNPNLPFVLVTAAGSEDVASEAIAAGVDDYLIKDPKRDNATLLAARIRTAVEKGRLRRRVAASEQRYRTLVEQSSDGILIVQDDDVVFANERAEELTGRVADLRGTPMTALFPENDAWDRSPSKRSSSFETELDPRGGRRTVWVNADRIDHEGSPATLWSFRDITERKRRERELRLDRDLREAFRDVLVDAATRGDLSAGLCRELAETGHYEFAWVGEPVDGELRPATWAGDAGEYLDSFDHEIESGDEPSLWAVRSQSPQFINDVSTLFGSPWRGAALDRGYNAVAALPLVYDGLSYGVLAVYAGESDTFDAIQQELLRDLAEALAYAIDSMEQTNALATGSRRQVGVRIEDPAHPFVALTAGTEGNTSVTATATVSQSVGGDAVFATVSGIDPAAACTELEAHEAVAAATVVDATSQRVRVTFDGPTVGSIVAQEGGIVVEQCFENGVGEATFTLGVDRNMRSVVDELAAAFGATVLSVSESSEHGRTPEERLQHGMGGLTAKQAEALQTAHHAGYFEQPRANSADDVAAMLDISRSTFLQHLRSAQRKLFEAVFESE